MGRVRSPSRSQAIRAIKMGMVALIRAMLVAVVVVAVAIFGATIYFQGLVTGAGGFPSPFFGTSAAAPHVAGVAALRAADERGDPAVDSEMVGIGDTARKDQLDGLADFPFQIPFDSLHQMRVRRNHIRRRRRCWPFIPR